MRVATSIAIPHDAEVPIREGDQRRFGISDVEL
jgi:hypothetical protein